MNRAVLEACFPCLIALAISCTLLWAVGRLSGARPRWRRFAELHRCQAGGVQSLAFVLTLPVFLLIVLFIVQVSQVMIGMMTVNYAAYASARAASVWIPALVQDAHGYTRPTVDPWFPVVDTQNRMPARFGWGEPMNYDRIRNWQSVKCEKIYLAAAIACTSIAPSRDLDSANTALLSGTRADEAMINAFPLLSPAAGSNSRLPQRIRNKLAYSLENTWIEITFVPKDSETEIGPTYNPRDHDWDDRGEPYDFSVDEVGWQDAVTVKVWHHFGLLPGPGHFLSNVVFRPDGSPDIVAQRIDEDSGMHKTWLTASATMTVEGLQSSKPYLHQEW